MDIQSVPIKLEHYEQAASRIDKFREVRPEDSRIDKVFKASAGDIKEILKTRVDDLKEPAKCIVIASTDGSKTKRITLSELALLTGTGITMDADGTDVRNDPAKLAKMEEQVDALFMDSRAEFDKQLNKMRQT